MGVGCTDPGSGRPPTRLEHRNPYSTWTRYYDSDPLASLAPGRPATWQYETDPFCEPPLIPGTPNNSAGMEQFNDTPIVNGTAYPTMTLDPKAYRCAS